MQERDILFKTSPQGENKGIKIMNKAKLDEAIELIVKKQLKEAPADLHPLSKIENQLYNVLQRYLTPSVIDKVISEFIPLLKKSGLK